MNIEQINLEPGKQLAGYQIEYKVVEGTFCPLPGTEVWKQEGLTIPNYVRFATEDQMKSSLVKDWENKADAFRRNMDEYKNAYAEQSGQKAYQPVRTRYPGIVGY